MGRNRGKDRQALLRIVALLFAFAALAGRAGTRPRPIRVSVLWLLRAAESVAWHFVVAVAREAGADSGLAIPPRPHDVADDAARLAESFTALAELLAGLARSGPSRLPHGGIGGHAGHLTRTLRNLAHALATLQRPRPDTS